MFSCERGIYTGRVQNKYGLVNIHTTRDTEHTDPLTVICQTCSLTCSPVVDGVLHFFVFLNFVNVMFYENVIMQTRVYHVHMFSLGNKDCIKSEGQKNKKGDRNRD